MKINSIRIVDFKGIEDLTINFNDRFTVLIGGNGIGKTSILDALATAINPYIFVSQKKNLRPIRKEDVRLTKYGYEKLGVIKTGVIVSGEINGKNIEWTIKKSHYNFGFLHGDTKKIKSEAKEQLRNIEENIENITLPVFDYLGAGRLWNKPTRKINQKTNSRFEGYWDCLDSAISFNRFAEWFKKNELAMLSGNSNATIKSKVIKRAITSCLQGWDNIHYDLELKEIIALRGPLSKKEMLPLRLLSDGQRNIIAIVTDIAFRCIQLNPHLKLNSALESPGIILIDELDLHLHPKWQKTIVNSLKDAFQNLQFIATTHSPFIVQSLSNSELFDLEGKDYDSDYYNKGIEDIAINEMGVKDLRSSTYVDMFENAEKYYTLIDKLNSTSNSSITIEINKELDFLENKYAAFNPAYAALLKSERKAKKYL